MFQPPFIIIQKNDLIGFEYACLHMSWQFINLIEYPNRSVTSLLFE